MEEVIIFDTTLRSLLRIVVVGTLTYISIIILLRMSGKRTLAQMNAFDFVITVTIGSAYGRILTASKVSYFEALTAVALLIALQYIVALLSSRSDFFKNFVTAQPRLLYYNGKFIQKNMKRERLNEQEVMSAARNKNANSMDEIEAIIFETTGKISIIKKSSTNTSSIYPKVLEEER